MDYPYAHATRRETDFKFEARCQCGWIGYVRDTFAAAENDAVAHNPTHDPFDGECPHCGTRNWARMDADECECYDCGRTFRAPTRQ